LAFFVGFLARPLGALWFGMRGDLASPRKAIKESAMVMIVSTIFMGVLPQAPTSNDLVFVLLRCLQGVGLGGCYAAMAVFLYEGAPEGQKGRFTSWIQSSVPVGYIAALLGVLLLKMIFAAEFYVSGGWRLAFFMPVCALFFLGPLKDTRKYNIALSQYAGWLRACVLTIKKEWSHWSAYLILTVGIGILAFTAANYKFYFMKVILKMDPVVVDLSSGVGTLLFLPFYYLGGRITDRYDKFKVCWLSVVGGAILMLPSFHMLEWTAGAMNGQILKIIFAVGILSAVIVISFGSLISLLCELFPQKMRCTLFALVYTLTVGVTGSVAHGYGISAYMRSGEKYAGLYLAVLVALAAAGISAVLRRRWLKSLEEPGR
jgi:hypothetical protein